MNTDIAETLTKQGEIIRIQSRIIDKLALSLLQYTQIEEATLNMIKDVAQEREGMEERR